MLIKKTPKNAKKFMCNICNFECSKKSEYNRHLVTAKHKRLINPNAVTPKNAKIYSCPCGKDYKHMASLCKHKKLCHSVVDENEENTLIKEDTTDYKAMFLESMSQNKELMNLLKDQSKTIQEMVPKMGNNNNNTTNNNNKFNLQVFLNEDCKDAINFSDFIESIKVTVEDLENQAQVGYVEGISKLFLENMKELGVNKRPIHCTDKKRNTLYIKENNEWDKEGSQDQLLHGIKVVNGRAHQTLCDMKEENPEEYSDMDSDFSNKCINIQRSLLPGFPREATFGKVIDSISTSSTIDRESDKLL
jgi:hypothetical protein